jgi:two-component system OmpR family response regulator
MSEAHNQSTLGGEGAAGHVLIVDDDAEIRNLAAKFLRAHGHRATAVRDGREMWPTLKTAAVDLIVLDVMLPGTNGLDLCRELRKTSKIPIIMLTALGADTDRIVGLELGADDYLAKPFNPRELLARVNAVLRRAKSASESPEPAKAAATRLVFEEWTLDLMRRELLNPQGVVVDLSTGEFDMLLTFLEAPQRVLTREQLLDGAKNRVATGFDRVIDVQISRLRRKIEASEDSQAMIKTIRGVGYMFVPMVRRE